MPAAQAGPERRSQKPAAFACAVAWVSLSFPEKNPPVPLCNRTTAPAPHDRMKTGVYQRNDSFGIEPPRNTHKGQHLPARVDRTTLQRKDVAGRVPATQCLRQCCPGKTACARIGSNTDEALGKFTRCRIVRVINDASRTGQSIWLIQEHIHLTFRKRFPPERALGAPRLSSYGVS